MIDRTCGRGERRFSLQPHGGMHRRVNLRSETRAVTRQEEIVRFPPRVIYFISISHLISKYVLIICVFLYSNSHLNLS